MAFAISAFEVMLFSSAVLGFCTYVTSFLISKHFPFLNVTTVSAVVLHNLLIKSVNDILFLFCMLI